MRIPLTLVLIFCLAAQTHSVAADDPVRTQIQHWISQLGDDSFLVRQRAEVLLQHAGIRAYSELRRAEQHYDQEIVRRAEHLLSQIEQSFLAQENRETATWIRWYMEESNPTVRANVIEALADPTLDLTKGEGLHTLCRLLRFESDASLRLHAAKTLIAYPPVSTSLRQHWFRHIRDTFSDIGLAGGDDALFQTLAKYAELWCDLEDGERMRDVANMPDRVRQVAADTLNLLTRLENNIHTNSGIDILFHYAVAELYDAAGLVADRDQTVAAALAVVPQPFQAPELVLPVGDVDRSLFMHEHYHTAMCLLLRFRLHWAMAHFEKVIESGNVLLRVPASESAAHIALYLADYVLAAEFYDTQIAILNSPEYRAGHDPTRQIAEASKQKLYCLAKQHFNDENWAEARAMTMQALAVSDAPIEMQDIDLAILAYRLACRPDVDLAFKNAADGVLPQVWRSIANFHVNWGAGEMRLERLPIVANAAAWLLANTDGDYRSALVLSESALHSNLDDVNFLDTLSHVYFLGGDIEGAVRTQERVVRIASEVVVFRRALERFRSALRNAMPEA
ncbi:MAG: hypothetical protein FWG73_04755 [Planctomycetaceae bacterium]|nr:hypothetical protein [Planctomycetaceae bacterium]